jgi:predicted nuclease of predicted toxin-antitoxin system
MKRSKDRDFLTIRAAAETGPIVVWVRAGNVKNRQLIEGVMRALPITRAALEPQEKVIEIASPWRD